ncbi:MAG TPA: DUF3175 domain-containing protein [Stellaceae bacterium]|jgi:hypothetical protein
MARKRRKPVVNRQKSRSRQAAGTVDKKQKYWSAEVMQKSDALDIEPGTFAKDDPKEVALALKRSAEESTRRKAPPYRSAMSMLTFFINRAGRNLSDRRRRILERAKDELRRVFGKA